MQISRWPKSDARWYLGVRCRKCQSPILFALDQSDGKHDLAPIAKLVLTCSQSLCGHKADYSMSTVSRFQKTAQAPKVAVSSKRGRARTT